MAILVLVAAACTSTGDVSDRTPGGAATTTTTAPPTTTSLPPTTTTTVAPLTVAGKVVGPEESPVANARVSIGDVTTTTGADGFFDLETPGPGMLTVTRPGWTEAEIAWDADDSFTHVSIEPRRIRGIRVGAGATGDDEFFGSLLELADATAVNALVFDTKQEGGKVLYDTDIPEAHQMGAVDVWYDPGERLAQARDRGLYTITRIVTFEDAFRAAAFPKEKMAGPWIDPRSAAAREYNIALATEACRLGFDEIQFDYVRFPAGRTAEVSGQLDLSQEERVSAVESFLEEARAELEPLGCAISADIFAIVVSVPDDQGLGQRPEELSPHLDALSPMVYPSHYSLGWLGFADPNDHPYEVTADAIDDALLRIHEQTVLRPWLQAFWWSNDQIRRSIQAAEDRGVGWILWNVGSNFSRAAIPTDAEVGS